MKTFTAVIQKDEDMHVAKCSEVGTVSQGSTIDEAIANLREATEIYLEEFPLKEKYALFDHCPKLIAFTIWSLL